MIRYSIGSNNIIAVCEAQGCSAVAEEQITVAVGQIGEITLSVCGSCKPKFISLKLLNIEKTQYSESMVARPDQSLADHRRAKELHPDDRV
jgi:hypothetical protein